MPIPPPGAPVNMDEAELLRVMRQQADDIWHLPGHQDCARTLADYANRVEGLLLQRAQAIAALQSPDPPHVREDYREVWASGWRAGVVARATRPEPDVHAEQPEKPSETEIAAMAEAMASAAAGEPVSEFMASFPAVRDVLDLRARADAAEAQLTARTQEIEQAQATIPHLQALVADWWTQAEQARAYPATNDAKQYYGNGLAWAYDQCADELAAALRSAIPAPREPQIEEEKEDPSRVGPLKAGVAPTGSTAEDPSGVVTAAERTETK